MQIVRAGVQRAAEELAASGVELIMRENRGLDTEMVLEHIEELVSQGVQGLAIAPNNSPEIRQCIDELYEQGIPVITLNSDAPGSRRLAFIGMDNYRAGQTAAGLLRLMLPEGGKVLPLAGHLNNTAHNNRLNGFMDTINDDTGNEIELLAFQPCFDRDDYAHEITQHALRANPDPDRHLRCVNGQVGACAAVEEEGRKGKVKVVAFDLNPMNMELLQSDSLSFVLDRRQKAFEQGLNGRRSCCLITCRTKKHRKKNCFIRILQSKPSLTAINLWEWNKPRKNRTLCGSFNGKMRMEKEYGELL